MLRSLTVHLSSCLLAACAQTAPPVSGSNERVSVTGTVVSSETGEPIHGALVELGPLAVMSDNKGHFVFDSVPAMFAAIYAQKPGYFSPTQLRNQFQQQEMIKIQPGIAPTTIKLIPEAIISGQVTSSEGEPLDSIPLEVMSSMITDGIRTWQQRAGAQTDDEGRFRISELQPGTYYISAGPSRSFLIAAPGTANAIPPQQGFAKVYFPAAPDLSGATPIVVTPGKHIEANFTLASQAMYRISGTVSGFAPNQNVSVQIASSSGAIAGGMGLNPRTGTFTSGYLVPDTYELRAVARNPGGPQLPGSAVALGGRVSVDLTSDVSNVHIMLAPQPAIPIKTKVDWAEQPQGDYFQPVMIQLYPEDSAPRMRQIRASISMFGPNGPHEMSISEVEPGRYWADIRPNGPLYVASATYGDVDLLRDDLVIGADIGSQPIEIYLRDDGGAIQASVNFPGEKSRVTVFFVSEENPRSVHISFTGNDGVARVSLLAPGAYKVFALDNADGLEYRKPDALQEFLSSAGEVTVGPKGQASVTVQLIHRED